MGDVLLVPEMQVTPDRENATLAISKDNYSKPGCPRDIFFARGDANKWLGTELSLELSEETNKCAVIRRRHQIIIHEPACLTHQVTGNDRTYAATSQPARGMSKQSKVRMGVKNVPRYLTLKAIDNCMLLFDVTGFCMHHAAGPRPRWHRTHDDYSSPPKIA